MYTSRLLKINKQTGSQRLFTELKRNKDEETDNEESKINNTEKKETTIALNKPEKQNIVVPNKRNRYEI